MNNHNINQSEKVQASPYIYATINFGHRAISGMLAYKEGPCLIPLCIKSYPNSDTFWHGSLTNAMKFREIMKLLINDFRSELSKNFKDNVSLQKVYIGISPMSMELVKWSYSENYDEPRQLTKGILNHLSSQCLESFETEEQKRERKRTYIDLLSPIYYTDKNFDKANTAESISMLKKRSVEVNQQLLCVKEEYLNAIKESLQSSQAFPDLDFHFFGNPLVEAKFWAERENQDYVYVNMGAGSTTIFMTKDGLFPQLIVLPLGGNTVTKDLKEYFSISEELAEELKIKYAEFNEIDQYDAIETNFQQPDVRIGDKVFSISNLNKLVFLRTYEILFTVKRYIERAHPNSKPNKIIFYGGGTHLQGFESLLTFLKFKTSDIEVKKDLSKKIEQTLYNQHQITWDTSIKNEDICTLMALVNYVVSASSEMRDEYGYSVEVKDAFSLDFEEEFSVSVEPIPKQEKPQPKVVAEVVEEPKKEVTPEDIFDVKEEEIPVHIEPEVIKSEEEPLPIKNEPVVEIPKEKVKPSEPIKEEPKKVEPPKEEGPVLTPEDMFGGFF